MRRGTYSDSLEAQAPFRGQNPGTRASLVAASRTGFSFCGKLRRKALKSCKRFEIGVRQGRHAVASVDGLTKFRPRGAGIKWQRQSERFGSHLCKIDLVWHRLDAVVFGHLDLIAVRVRQSGDIAATDRLGDAGRNRDKRDAAGLVGPGGKGRFQDQLVPARRSDFSGQVERVKRK